LVTLVLLVDKVVEVVVGELGSCGFQHVVVKLIRDDGFTSEEPQEGLGEAARVNDGVAIVIGLNNLVVGLFGGNVEGNVALTRSIGAVTITDDAAGRGGDGVLSLVVDNEVARTLEVRVISSGADAIIGLEELSLDVGLFVPGAHVSGTIEVGEGGGVVALGEAIEEVGD
jgi:hypothetical protein